MSLYRCELCGSENVVMYENGKLVSFPTEQIKNNDTVHFEYKCMDCLHISVTTMRSDIKQLIDNAVPNAEFRTNMTLNGKNISWAALERSYPNIISDNTDIVKTTALNLLRHLNEDVFDFNELKLKQLEWENANNVLIEKRKIKYDEIQAKQDEYYNKILSDKNSEFAKKRNMLKDKLYKYEEEFTKLNKKLRLLKPFELTKKHKLKKNIDDLYALRYRTEIEIQNLTVNYKVEIKNLTVRKENNLKSALDIVDKEFPLRLSPMQKKRKWIERNENINNRYIYDIENYVLLTLKYGTEALNFEQICDVLNLCEVQVNKTELKNAMRSLFIHGYIEKVNTENRSFFEPECKYVISK